VARLPGRSGISPTGAWKSLEFDGVYVSRKGALFESRDQCVRTHLNLSPEYQVLELHLVDAITHFRDVSAMMLVICYDVGLGGILHRQLSRFEATRCRNRASEARNDQRLLELERTRSRRICIVIDLGAQVTQISMLVDAAPSSSRPP